MMPSSGPPTPKGVGGPTPPLVSRGSEEEWKMKIPTGGPPTLVGGKGGVCPYSGGSVEPTLTRGEDEEPPPTQRGGEVHPPQGGEREPPPTREGREKDGGREEGSQQDRSKKSTRRAHTSRELRMLDPSENPPPQRVRRPTRGTDTIDNSCEVTRESNMICPITCGCRNSFLDIRGKTRVVSHILQATRKIWKNHLITSFGLTAAITNKDEI